MNLTEFVARHEKVVLQFSSGKDSAMCLRLLQEADLMEKVVVAWVNQGNPYPETLDYMANVEKSVPHFVMIPGDQPRFIAENGYPTDFNALYNSFVVKQEGPKLVPTFACCNHNLWGPLQVWLEKVGIKGIIRGVKAVDDTVILPQFFTDGRLEYYFPLRDWTDQDVVNKLGDTLPASYQRGLKKSLDCINCTGFMKHNKGKLADLEANHPVVAAEVRPVIAKIIRLAKEHLEAANGY